MQRIKRNEPYFTDRRKQNHWCEPCYNLLDPNQHVLLDDGSEVSKQELQELKNDALPEEGWVNCDSCHSWVHQVRFVRYEITSYRTSSLTSFFVLGMRAVQWTNK